MDPVLELFETRTMVDAVRQIKTPDTWLLSNFFTREKIFDTKKVDVDIYKARRRIARFDNPNAAGTVVTATGFKTITMEPAYMKPKIPTTADQLLNRGVGENLYDGKTAEQRAGEKLGEDFAELDAMIVRRLEHMAWRAVQDGNCVISGDGVSRTEDFDFDANHTEALLTVDQWDETTADPIADLLRWRKTVLRDYGYAATDVVFGESAASAFLNHPTVQDWFNKWNFVPGQIRPDARQNIISYGFIPALGMSLHQVTEFFIDPADGSEKEMVDANRVLLLTRGMRATQYYGAIMHMNALVGMKRFPHSYLTDDPSMRWVQLHSAPLMVPNEADAIFTATVI